LSDVLKVLEDAGVDPAKIYAFRKTGRLVFEGNEHLFPARDLEEWYAAIKEYEKTKRG
jgi:hypothetical protein